MWCETGVQFHSFACHCPVFPILFIAKTILSPLYILDSFVVNQLTVCVRRSACKSGDLGSIPESRKFPGEGNDYPLQYSCLEDSMGRGAWWAAIHGITESDMTEWLTVSLSFCFWSLFCSMDLCVCLGPVPHCFVYYSFIIWFEIRACDASNIVFLS